MQHERLLNFRIPSSLKAQFQALCSERKSNMTTEIVRLILQFVGNTPGATNPNTWETNRAR